MDFEVRPDVRPHRSKPRRREWPAWAYYVTAAFLVLLTVPMYRAIFSIRSAPRDPAPAPVVSASPPVSALPAVAPVPVSSPASVDWSRYRLADDQRCVGGAVVEVHGTDYRQIGTISEPVHCDSGYADRPLR